MPAAITELAAHAVPPTDVTALRSFAARLEAPELRDLLLGLAESVESGTDITLLPADAELTPQQVADRLKMSRTHLYKLLDNGTLPSVRVGSHRRVLFSDVVAFEHRRQRDRRELAERFAHENAGRNGAIDELAAQL